MLFVFISVLVFVWTTTKLLMSFAWEFATKKSRKCKLCQKISRCLSALCRSFFQSQKKMSSLFVSLIFLTWFGSKKLFFSFLSCFVFFWGGLQIFFAPQLTKLRQTKSKIIERRKIVKSDWNNKCILFKRWKNNIISSSS